MGEERKRGKREEGKSRRGEEGRKKTKERDRKGEKGRLGEEADKAKWSKDGKKSHHIYSGN